MNSLSKYCVNPKKFSLADFNPKDKAERTGNHEQNTADLTELSIEINALRDILRANAKHKILLILQGMDASGKDGTVRHVFNTSDPLGIRLASFKAPSSNELAHDYLWRVHQQVPQTGELVIFNRSHYEDVLVVKVHDWIDDAECERRYTQINDFERFLTETGTTVIKCFLHISKEEQKKRLQERLDNAHKTWKFNPNDLQERALWPQYRQAYEHAIKATSTTAAPWYIVPADSKTNRNLLISRLLLHTLRSLKLAYPAVPSAYKSIVIAD